MYRHWEMFIRPALELIELNHLVEIGAATGLNTLNLIEYCRKRGAQLTSIECVPGEEVLEMLKQNSDVFTLISNMSLEAMPMLPDYEAILIDGDHNWYTVYNELKAIERTLPNSFPLVFCHDAAWPYARRDMYYSPESIPQEYRHDYAMKGILPSQAGLLEEFGFNDVLYNAQFEGNSRNGVLTAIEDFVRDSGIAFRMSTFNGFFGLCILATHELLCRFPKLNEFFDFVDRVAALAQRWKKS